MLRTVVRRDRQGLKQEACACVRVQLLPQSQARVWLGAEDKTQAGAG